MLFRLDLPGGAEYGSGMVILQEACCSPVTKLFSWLRLVRHRILYAEGFQKSRPVI